jgi:hypothetical protein
MPDTILSEAETERIIGLSKRIVGQNQWREGDDGNWYMEMSVEAEEQLPLHLYGRFNPRTGNYTFILFCGRLNLRRLDVGKHHHNPECDNVGTPHKHRWTDRFRDNWAYEPPEMDDMDSISDTFAKLLTECNITLDGRFVEPPHAYQRRLI